MASTQREWLVAILCFAAGYGVAMLDVAIQLSNRISH